MAECCLLAHFLSNRISLLGCMCNTICHNVATAFCHATLLLVGNHSSLLEKLHHYEYIMSYSHATIATFSFSSTLFETLKRVS